MIKKGNNSITDKSKTKRGSIHSKRVMGEIDNKTTKHNQCVVRIK